MEATKGHLDHWHTLSSATHELVLYFIQHAFRAPPMWGMPPYETRPFLTAWSYSWSYFKCIGSTIFFAPEVALRFFVSTAQLALQLECPNPSCKLESKNHTRLKYSGYSGYSGYSSSVVPPYIYSTVLYCILFQIAATKLLLLD